MSNGICEKRLLEIVKNNESEEFLVYFPKYKEAYEAVKKKYLQVLKELTSLYEEHKDISDQKEFAGKIKNHPLSGILFCVRNKKTTSITEGLRQFRTESILEYIKEKENV